MYGFEQQLLGNTYIDELHASTRDILPQYGIRTHEMKVYNLNVKSQNKIISPYTSVAFSSRQRPLLEGLLSGTNNDVEK